MSLNRLCLVINASYEAINVISARRALTLVFKGAAVVGFWLHYPDLEDQHSGAKRSTTDEVPAHAAAEPVRFPQGDPVARRQFLPVLRCPPAFGKPDTRSRGSAIAARALDLGEPGGMLLRLQ